MDKKCLLGVCVCVCVCERVREKASCNPIFPQPLWRKMEHNSIVLNKTGSVSWWFSGKVFFQQLVCMSSNPAIFLFFFWTISPRKAYHKEGRNPPAEEFCAHGPGDAGSRPEGEIPFFWTFMTWLVHSQSFRLFSNSNQNVLIQAQKNTPALGKNLWPSSS